MTLFASFAVFRNRAFTLLWVAQLISTMGSALTTLAAALVVYRLTGSALSVGLMMLAPTLPSLFLGLIAGVVVDRCDRKRLMIAVNLICAGLIALIPILLPLNIAWLYVLVILANAVGQFYDPAHAGLLPEVASDEELAAANALMAISAYGSQAVGFAASGLLAGGVSVAWAFYLDALSFVVAAGCILGIRVARFPVAGHTTMPAVARDLRAGLRFLRSKPILRSLFLIYMPIFACFGLGNALLLPLSQRVLHATEFEYGLIAGMEAAGYIIGSLLMARLADRMSQGRWIALSFMGMGLFGIALSQLPTVPLAALAILIVGINNAPSLVARQLVIQRNTPREMRGRVNSAFFVTRDVMFLAGMALSGLADFVDVRTLYLAGEVVVLGGGALVLVLPGLGRPVAEWRRVLRHSFAPRPAAAPAEREAGSTGLGLLPVLNREPLRSLLGTAQVRAFPAGTVIVQQGAPAGDAYFILEGYARVAHADRSGSRSLEVLSVGDFFGEIGALTGSPRTASVIAAVPTIVLEISAALLRQMQQQPQVNDVLQARLAERQARLRMLSLPALSTQIS